MAFLLLPNLNLVIECKALRASKYTMSAIVNGHTAELGYLIEC